MDELSGQIIAIHTTRWRPDDAIGMNHSEARHHRRGPLGLVSARTVPVLSLSWNHKPFGNAHYCTHSLWIMKRKLSSLDMSLAICVAYILAPECIDSGNGTHVFFVVVRYLLPSLKHSERTSGEAIRHASKANIDLAFKCRLVDMTWVPLQIAII